MFGLFKKKEVKLDCEHEWVNLGKYYVVYDSQYRNLLDRVVIYMRLCC